jgi:hypothetical protein
MVEPTQCNCSLVVERRERKMQKATLAIATFWEGTRKIQEKKEEGNNLDRLEWQGGTETKKKTREQYRSTTESIFFQSRSIRTATSRGLLGA